MNSQNLLVDVYKENNMLTTMEFILCQLENLLPNKNHRSYNIGTIIVALKSQLISPACLSISTVTRLSLRSSSFNT